MYRLWLLFIVADVYFTKIFIPTKELYVMEGVIKMESYLPCYLGRLVLISDTPPGLTNWKAGQYTP